MRRSKQQKKKERKQTSCKSESGAIGIHDVSNWIQSTGRAILLRPRESDSVSGDCRYSSSTPEGIAIRRPSQNAEPQGFTVEASADFSEMPNGQKFWSSVSMGIPSAP